MKTPVRIQRKRSKGWKAPLDTNGLPPVYVGRPSRFGNMWKVGAPICHARDAQDAVDKFEKTIVSKPELIALIKAKLRGRNLMCFCPLDRPCHADPLLRIANEEPTQ